MWDEKAEGTKPSMKKNSFDDWSLMDDNVEGCSVIRNEYSAVFVPQDLSIRIPQCCSHSCSQ